jgi:hypothetical protein
MSGLHILYAVLLYGVASNLTDWFFFGILFHNKYSAHPEVWRRAQGTGGEGKAIAWSSLISLLTIAGFICTCSTFSIHGYKPTLEFAALIWIIAPLPLTITNALFIKLHPLTVVSHSLGWLARLILAAIAVAFFLN